MECLNHVISCPQGLGDDFVPYFVKGFLNVKAGKFQRLFVPHVGLFNEVGGHYGGLLYPFPWHEALLKGAD